MHSKYLGKTYQGQTLFKCIGFEDTRPNDNKHKRFYLSDGKYLITVRDNMMTKLRIGEKTIDDVVKNKVRKASVKRINRNTIIIC